MRTGDPRSTQRWQRLRERIRKEAGHVCQTAGCYQPAREVHHKVALHRGGSAFGRNNLVLVCDGCHKAAHARERSSRLSRVPGRAEALANLEAKMSAYQHGRPL